MYSEERKHYIINLLLEKGALSVSEIAETLSVSLPTVRKDFDNISSENPYIIRTHGGLALLEQTQKVTNYTNRKSVNIQLKQAIATQAMRHIRNRSTIFLDSSSTCNELALKLLDSELSITVITSGLNTANILRENSRITVFLWGGSLRPNSNTILDISNGDFLKQFNIDQFFFSASGVSLTFGFSDYNINEVKDKSRCISVASSSIALVDSSKYEDNSNSSFATLSNVDLMISDDNIDDEIYKSYASHINIEICK